MPADVRAVCNTVNAEIRKSAAVANAGQQEKFRRFDGSSAQNNFARCVEVASWCCDTDGAPPSRTITFRTGVRVRISRFERRGTGRR